MSFPKVQIRMAIPELCTAFSVMTPVPAEELEIRSLTANDEGSWDSFVDNHSQGSFFHKLSWKRVMEKTFGYEPHYFLAVRGERVTGIAPSFLVSSWLTGKSLLSLPFAVYGGVCASDSQSEQALVMKLENLGRELAVDYIEVRNRDHALMPGYHANERYATFSIPIHRDIEALYAKFPKDIRYMIRKGEKAGLRCVHGLDQLDPFYHLMTLNLKRLGTPAFPRTLFENLLTENPGKVELTVLYSENKPVAAGMSFLFGPTMQPYYIGSTDQAKTLAANNLLWWELIKRAADLGCTVFDFGRSKKNSGNYDFKKKWNPTIEDLDYQIKLINRSDVPNFSPTNPNFDLMGSVWKKLPLGLTRTLGPQIVRWFP